MFGYNLKVHIVLYREQLSFFEIEGEVQVIQLFLESFVLEEILELIDVMFARYQMSLTKLLCFSDPSGVNN